MLVCQRVTHAWCDSHGPCHHALAKRPATDHRSFDRRPTSAGLTPASNAWGIPKRPGNPAPTTTPKGAPWPVKKFSQKWPWLALLTRFAGSGRVMRIHVRVVHVSCWWMEYVEQRLWRESNPGNVMPYICRMTRTAAKLHLFFFTGSLKIS